MESVGKRKRGKLVKLLFNFSDRGRAAIVFDVEDKSIRFGGPIKLEMLMRDIVKEYLNAKDIVLDSDREIKYKRKFERDGQVCYEPRTRRNGRIVFKFKCQVWQFNMGYRKMCDNRSSQILDFTEVESIGRIFN